LTAPEITAGSDPGLSFTYWNDINLTSPMSDPSRVSQSGTYYIQTSYVNECASNEPVSVVINIYQKIDGQRYPTQTTTPTDPLKLNARNIGNQYSWYPGNGLSETSIPQPTFQYDRDMEYTITMKTSNNCIVVDTVLVRVQQPNPIFSTIFVPKAWTPNNDGHNDRLTPLRLNIQEVKSFRIYNRWGQLVFETKAMGEGWDGIYKGQQQSTDVYTWTLDAIGVDGNRYRKSGNSVLMR
jgi:gliding motility-associated-like protein